MAKLESIFISGIRSYGITKNDAQTLTFYSPVTLFLGQNGCGKTTIIECVKHALTGEFPFSTKSGGQSFVADPNLYHTHSVKGCIKLKFRDVYGKPATIMRVLKLEVTMGKFKCQVQDASYTYIDVNGTEHSVSVKLADGKEMIKTLVGVTEPILSNVLFCHQEDSMWPLAEDGAVKKKFDQIFESSVFDTTVDMLTKDIKTRGNNIKHLKKELVFFKELKNASMEKRKLLKDKQELFELLKKEMDALNTRYGPLKKKIKDLTTMEESMTKLIRMKSEKENKLASNRQVQQTLQGLIKSVYEGTDEELEHEIKNFQVYVKEKEADLQRTEAQINKGKLLEKKILDEVQGKKTDLATIKEQIKVHKSKITERDEMACRLVKALAGTPIGSFEYNLNEIRHCLDKKKKDIGDKEIELNKIEDSVNKELDVANNKFLDIKGRQTVKQQEEDSVRKEYRNIKTQLENLSSSEMTFKRFSMKLQHIESEIDKIQKQFNLAAEEKKIHTNKREIRDLEEKIQDLEKILKLFNQNEMIENSIEHHQLDKLTKEKKIRALKNHHYSQLKQLFPGIEDKMLRIEADKTFQKVTDEMQEKRDDLKVKVDEERIQNVELSVQKSKIEAIKQELEANREAIEKFCKTELFETTLDTIVEENRTLQKKKGQLSAFRIIYKDFVSDLNEKKCCPVCETDFSANPQRVKQLAGSMSQKIEKVPETLRETTTRLDKSQKLENELTKLQPMYMKLTKLEHDLKEKENFVSTTEISHNRLTKEIAALTAETEKGQSILDICAQLAPSVSMIEQCAIEIENATEKIEDLKTTLQDTSENGTKAETEMLIEQMKQEISRKNEEIEHIRNNISTNQKRLLDYRTEKMKLAEDQNKLEGQGNIKPQLIKKQTELETKLKEIGEILESVENDSMMAVGDIQELKTKLINVKREHASIISALRTKLQANTNEYDVILKIMNEIEIGERKNLMQQCETINQEIEELGKKYEEMQDKINVINGKREKVKVELHDQDSAQKSLEHNKTLRELKVEETQLKHMVNSIESDIGRQHGDNLEFEKLTMQKEMNTILSNIAKTDGEMKSLKEHIKDLTSEIRDSKANPFETYVDRVTEIQLEEVAIAGLKRAVECISVSICKFHREQLLSINIRLRDLWRSVYKGNDIDYIQIESGETQMTANKRVYEYRLMQKKGGVLMPMRGKCSAGQKVLACLLVRIVLAEHVSSDCGIFALDEPTTNLDRDNIRSLSQAIARLINSHRLRSNFQFLIITHDEEFLDALREVDAVKDYFRVSRNFKGNTIISREEI